MDANPDAQPAAAEVAMPIPEFSAQKADSMKEQVAVTLQGITKSFNDIYALRNVSITIQPGEVFGLLGPTGAGKSTLVKLLLGLLQPDEGTISVFGSADPQVVKARTGYMPERARYHHNFTGRDYLLFHARLSGLTLSGARKAVDQAIEVVGLGPAARRQIRYYERETVQRLAFAVAMVSIANRSPGLLILDEPSNNLGRAAQISLRDIILDFKQQGTTVLIASHRITEIERTSTSVGILRGGRLVAHTNVENNPRVIVVAVPRDSSAESYPRLLAHLRNLHPFVSVTGGAGGAAPIVVSLPSGPRIVNAAGIKASALRALMDTGWEVISVYVERKDLESIYAQTAPPQPLNQGEHPSLTGPLPSLTTPLSQNAGASTGPLPGLTQSLNGHNTRPLSTSEVSHLAGPEPSVPLNGQAGSEPTVSLNGHQPAPLPIEGRALRREEV
jgi:ABC-type multidrug transport system ATPase subunit